MPHLLSRPDRMAPAGPGSPAPGDAGLAERERWPTWPWIPELWGGWGGFGGVMDRGGPVPKGKGQGLKHQMLVVTGGEYVVHAKAAKKHRKLLEQMNRDPAP